MDYKYSYSLTDFLNDKCDLESFEESIRDSTISIALDYINQNSGVDIFFKAELSTTEEEILDHIVATHTGKPAAQASVIVKSEVLTEHIRYVEANDVTQGMFGAKSLIIDVSAGDSEKITDFTWPINVAIMSGTLGVSEDMIGDELIIEVGPNTLIGALTDTINVGDTIINVSPTVITNIKQGFWFGIYGNNGICNELGMVIDIDQTNNTITVDTPSTITVNPGTYVAMCPKIVPHLYLHDMSKIEIGKNITTGQRIPKNIPVRVTYKNNNGIAKKISFFVEYLY